MTGTVIPMFYFIIVRRIATNETGYIGPYDRDTTAQWLTALEGYPYYEVFTSEKRPEEIPLLLNGIKL